MGCQAWTGRSSRSTDWTGNGCTHVLTILAVLLARTNMGQVPADRETSWDVAKDEPDVLFAHLVRPRNLLRLWSLRLQHCLQDIHHRLHSDGLVATL
jgi:hypothetical protein